MQISTTTPAIKNCLRRIFTTSLETATFSKFFSSSSTDSANPSQNSFAFTINNTYPNWTDSGAKFRLMQGTVPTDFSTLVSHTDRAADILVEWTVRTTSGSWEDNSDNSIYLTSTDLAYATQSGTATWLWWVNRVYNTTAINHQAVFTVGALGSGEDFELANTSIVAGKGYKLVNGPTVSLPTEYNY